MLRIVEEKAADGRAVLRLDGRIAGQWIGVLRSCCDDVLKRNGLLTLDLSGVTFTDMDGLRLLHDLEQRLVTMCNGSPFLLEQMKQANHGLKAEEPSH